MKISKYQKYDFRFLEIFSEFFPQIFLKILWNYFKLNYFRPWNLIKKIELNIRKNSE